MRAAAVMALIVIPLCHAKMLAAVVIKINSPNQTLRSWRNSIWITENGCSLIIADCSWVNRPVAITIPLAVPDEISVPA